MTKILIVDDIDENRYLLEVLLKGNGYEVMTAAHGEEAWSMAQSDPPDLIITDILMPVMDGFTLCRKWKSDSRLKEVPFIFYTATYTGPKDEELGLSLGAERFVIKPQQPEELTRLIGEVLAEVRSGSRPASQEAAKDETEFLREYNEVLFQKLEKKMQSLEQINCALEQEIAERKQTEQSLRESEQKLKALLDASPTAIGWTDKAGALQYVNKKFVELFGYSREELGTIDQWFRHAYPDADYRQAIVSAWQRDLAAQAAGMTNQPLEVRVTCKDGATRHVTFVSAVIADLTLAIFNDLTEHKKLEEQLRQAQKMEAIGQLAGGVAHDFNNILNAVLGYASLLLMNLADDDPNRTDVEQILTAANRATVLTKSLLAFSRKQVVDIEHLDLKEVVTHFEKFLLRLLREDIALKIINDGEALPILADRGQIEQVLMNLVVNARDAMPNGGSLTIETDLVIGSPSHSSVCCCGEEKGDYALLTVADTGTGMSIEVQEKIFEPFFTTKEMGKGTGLGLAMVYGIVRQHQGCIDVESQPGVGTTFKIYFPIDRHEIKQEEVKAEDQLPIRGGEETILVAEDDDSIRDLVNTVLGRYGYTVIEAKDGLEAVTLFSKNLDRIQLVLLDGIMPKMNGKEAWQEITTLKPGIKTIFMSGYTDDIFSKSGFPEQAAFIPKPMSISTLARMIREVMDA